VTALKNNLNDSLDELNPIVEEDMNNGDERDGGDEEGGRKWMRQQLQKHRQELKMKANDMLRAMATEVMNVSVVVLPHHKKKIIWQFWRVN
jgi:hypothetical protein